MTIRVIDIETTGIDPTVDAIIEIASVDLLKDGMIANQRTALVRPPLPVPPEASAVHHLIDEDLAFAPELGDVLDQFRGADATSRTTPISSARSWSVSWATPSGPARTSAL